MQGDASQPSARRHCDGKGEGGGSWMLGGSGRGQQQEPCCLYLFSCRATAAIVPLCYCAIVPSCGRLGVFLVAVVVATMVQQWCSNGAARGGNRLRQGRLMWHRSTGDTSGRVYLARTPLFDDSTGLKTVPLFLCFLFCCSCRASAAKGVSKRDISITALPANGRPLGEYGKLWGVISFAFLRSPPPLFVSTQQATGLSPSHGRGYARARGILRKCRFWLYFLSWLCRFAGYMGIYLFQPRQSSLIRPVPRNRY